MKKTVFMSLTLEEAKHITQLRNKKYNYKNLIQKRLEQLPSLEEILEIVGMKKEDFLPGDVSSTTVKYSWDPAKECIVQTAFIGGPQTPHVDEVMTVYRGVITEFTKQKLPTKTQIVISVIDNKVIDIESPAPQYVYIDIQHILPNVKENLIEIMHKTIGRNIRELEDRLARDKRNYENTLSVIQKYQEVLGEDYNLFKNY